MTEVMRGINIYRKGAKMARLGLRELNRIGSQESKNDKEEWNVRYDWSYEASKHMHEGATRM